MADIRTTEGLRERLVASTGEHPAVFGAAEVAELLCGLDIAEKAMWALRTLSVAARLRAEQRLDPRCIFVWEMTAKECVLQAQAEWDKWKGEPNPRPGS